MCEYVLPCTWARTIKDNQELFDKVRYQNYTSLKFWYNSGTWLLLYIIVYNSGIILVPLPRIWIFEIILSRCSQLYNFKFIESRGTAEDNMNWCWDDQSSFSKFPSIDFKSRNHEPWTQKFLELEVEGQFPKVKLASGLLGDWAKVWVDWPHHPAFWHSSDFCNAMPKERC